MSPIDSKEEIDFKEELYLENRKFTVYLSSNYPKSNEILETTGKYELPEKKWLGIFHRSNKGEYTALIEPILNSSESNKLVGPNGKPQPFKCKFKNKGYQSKCDFPLDGDKELFFDLAFDPKEIIDYDAKIKESTDITIPFKLKIYRHYGKLTKWFKRIFGSGSAKKGLVNSEGEELAGTDDGELVDVREDYIILKLEKIEPNVNIAFVPDSTYKEKFELKNIKERTNILLGHFEISHNSSLQAAPDITDLEISFESKEFSMFDIDVCNIISTMKTGAKNVTISSLTSGETIKIPVKAGELANPTEDTNVNFSATIAKINGTKKEETRNNIGGFRLIRDNTKTEARIQLKAPGETYRDLYYVTDKETTIDTNKITLSNNLYIPDNKFQIIFSNRSTQPNPEYAGIYIWDVKVTPYIDQSHAKRLILFGESTDTTALYKLEKFLEIRDIPSSIIRLANDPNKRYTNIHTCNIIFHKDILEATSPDPKEKETFIKISFKLEYTIFTDESGNHYFDFCDKNGNIKKGVTDFKGGQKKNATFNILFKKEPRPEILCVDFGTSAIVAGTHINEIFNICDLQYEKKFLLSDNDKIRILQENNQILDKITNDPNERWKVEDTFIKELIDGENAPFINSRIFINDKYFIQTGQQQNYDYIAESLDDSDIQNAYKLYPIWVSPLMNQVKYELEIPCLKSIIGYRQLPIKASDDNKEWEYIDNNNKQAKVFYDNGCPNAIFNTDNIFRLCYKQLFTHLIRRKHKDKNKIDELKTNNLILTIPNTYTPLNIQKLKQIARESFPSVYPERLLTLSESDAVACYFISKSDPEATENKNILIYDMGAGTLDITLLKHSKKEHKDIIEIQNKIGVNMAGNYLDYVILEILQDYCQKDSNITEENKQKFAKLLNTESQPRSRNALKRRIKEIKSKLHDKTQENIKIETDGLTLSFTDLTNENILRHPRFEEFIKNVTKNVLDNFLGSSKHDIDIVVFSGRSTALEDIRNNVSTYIREHINNPENLLFANLNSDGTIGFEEEASNINTESITLKDVVARGASIYASNVLSQNFELIEKAATYASLGILITKGIHNDVYYVPLINKETLFDDKGKVVSKPIRIRKDGIKKIELVQSYSSDTAEDCKNDRTWLISPLIQITVEHFNSLGTGDECEFKLTLYDQSRHQDKEILELEVNKIPIPLALKDDFDSAYIRKGFWPVLFDDKTNNF